MRSPDASLDELLSVTQAGEGRYTVELPSGWGQGRFLFGGLVAGLLTRALETFRPGKPLRSLAAELTGPARPGEGVVELDVLRDGNTVSTVSARLVQDGEVMAHAVGVLGGPRDTEKDRVALAPPTLTDWRTLEPLPVAPPFGPEFAHHWDFRTDVHAPFSGGSAPVTAGWIRPKQPVARRDAAFLATCADTWWPALYSVLDAPRPMATIAFGFQPVGDCAGLEPDAPLRFRGGVQVVHGGYCVEFRELWGHDGRLLALNQQTFCVLK